MFELLRDYIFKALGFVLPSVVRWFYKPEKFDKDIKIRIRGDVDGITYNCGQLPNVRVLLLITNLSPIEITFDRMYGQLICGCDTVAVFGHLRRCVLPPAQERDVLIEFSLTDSQSAFIKRNHGKNDTRLSLGAYVTSKIHSIELGREISAHNVRCVNCTL